MAPGLVHVAVGVLLNGQDEVLLSLRHPDSHQGGLWEFPGGKLEPGESLFEGLRREFSEELDIEILSATPLRRIRHRYADKEVLLDTCLIHEVRGQPRGMEGQVVQWRALSSLKASDFPAANLPILGTLRLATQLFITPELDSEQALLAVLRQQLSAGRRMIQLRQKQLDTASYRRRYSAAAALCSAQGCVLFYSHAEGPPPDLPLSAYHSSAAELMTLGSRPLVAPGLFSAACHNLRELARARELGADMVLLSPVLPTPSHPGAQALGWTRFAELAGAAGVPVFALGGVGPGDLERARRHGAWGVAGISAFLS